MTSVQLYRKIRLWFKISVGSTILAFAFSYGLYILGSNNLNTFIPFGIGCGISILSEFIVEKAENDFIKSNTKSL